MTTHLLAVLQYNIGIISQKVSQGKYSTLSLHASVYKSMVQ